MYEGASGVFGAVSGLWYLTDGFKGENVISLHKPHPYTLRNALQFPMRSGLGLSNRTLVRMKPCKYTPLRSRRLSLATLLLCEVRWCGHSGST
eukprot:6653604-Pyramimonas_sp.AAC.1